MILSRVNTFTFAHESRASKTYQAGSILIGPGFSLAWAPALSSGEEGTSSLLVGIAMVCCSARVEKPEGDEEKTREDSDEVSVPGWARGLLEPPHDLVNLRSRG